MNKGLICLLMNLVIPGYGSIMAGDKSTGFWQLGLFFGGVITSVIGIGLFAILGAIIWGLVDGLKYKDTLRGNLTNGNLAFILNVTIPGIGSLVFGDKNNGIWQFLLYTFGSVVGIGSLPGLIWSFIDGINLNDTLTEESGRLVTDFQQE